MSQELLDFSERIDEQFEITISIEVSIWDGFLSLFIA